MQVEISKVKVIDIGSAFHDQWVDISIVDGVIDTIVASKKTKSSLKVAKDGSGKSRSDTFPAGSELCVSTGWVDAFADYCDPGFEQKETLVTGSACAAAGGFTDVMIVPNTQPSVSTKSSLQYIADETRVFTTKIHPIGSITQNVEGKQLAEMMDMQHHGAVAFSDGWKPLQQSNLMLKALEYVKAFDGTIIQIPIDEHLAKGGLMNEGVVSTALGMPGIPLLAETLMIYRDIELLKYTRSKLHITGITAAASVDLIRKAKAEGVPVTCSVTPYHLLLTDDALRKYDSAFKVNPPLRTESDRLALIEGLADGTIDCICSHHQPQEWDAKEKEFDYASNGMAIQEIAFPLIYKALHEKLSMSQIIHTISAAPRKIFGLPTAKIEAKQNACITLFNIAGSTSVTAQSKKSTGVNNPFLGQSFGGQVIGIFNNQKTTLNP